jgi:hypothetical protein
MRIVMLNDQQFCTITPSAAHCIASPKPQDVRVQPLNPFCALKEFRNDSRLSQL